MKNENNIKQIFQNAKFGDKFVTRFGKIALFIKKSKYDDNYIEFYIEDFGVVTVFANNGNAVNGDINHSIIGLYNENNLNNSNVN